MLVGIATSGDGAGMKTRLMSERRGPHVGLLGIGSKIDQLGHVVGHRRQFGQATLGQRLHAHLEAEIGHDGHQVAVADPLAVTVDGPLNLRGSSGHAGQGVGHPAAGVVVEVHTDLTVHGRHHVADRGPHLVGQRAAVRVAQHEAVGACLGSPL